MSAGPAEEVPPPAESSTVENKTRLTRALELLGNYPFCSGTLQQTRRWIACRDGTHGAAGR